MAQGDVHFKITADDQATAVLDEFKSGVEKSLESISSAMDGALGKIDSLASGTTGVLERLLEIVSNPSPWTVVSAAVAGAGAAFLYLKNQVAGANEEFQKVDRITQAMEAIAAKVGDLRFSNDTAGMSAGQRDIAAFGREVDAKPLPGLDKADRERRNYLREYIDNPNIWDSGQVDRKAMQIELDALNEKEAKANEREILLRDQQKRNYAAQINRRTSSERQAESQKAFDAMFKQMDDTLVDARYAAKTVGMTSEVEKKLAEFDRAYQKMDQSKLGDAERQKLAEAYEVQRKRLKTELDIEEAVKRRLKFEERWNSEVKAKAGELNRKLLEMDASKKLQHQLLELDLMKYFGILSPQEHAKAARKANDAMPKTPFGGNYAGYPTQNPTNAPTVSRFLLRGPGDSFDSQAATLKAVQDGNSDAKAAHIAIRRHLDWWKNYTETRRAKVQNAVGGGWKIPGGI